LLKRKQEIRKKKSHVGEMESQLFEKFKVGVLVRKTDVK